MNSIPEDVKRTAVEKSYLTPEMAISDEGVGIDLFINAMDTTAGERQGVDCIFGVYPAELKAIQDWVSVLAPAGRLTLVCPVEDHPKTIWLEMAGLVNRLTWEVDGWWVLTGCKRVPARESVQQAYSAKALSQSGCDCGCTDGGCCSPGEVSLESVGSVEWVGGYSDAEVAEVPAEAAEFSLGCGNPIGMAGIKPGETVLDIGSGGGLDVFLAAKRAGPSGHAIGVDMTPAMLQRARNSAKRAGITNVTFRHGFAEHLPVEDSSVDVIISNCVINLAEDKGKVFAEAYRVIKPGGRLEVNDMVFGGPVPQGIRTSKAGWSECISGALPEQEYVDLVRQAGFSDVRVTRSTSHGEASGVPVYSVQVSAKKD